MEGVKITITIEIDDSHVGKAGKMDKERKKDNRSDRERYEQTFDLMELHSFGNPVTIKGFSEALGLLPNKVRKWLKKNEKETVLRYKQGIMYREETKWKA